MKLNASVLNKNVINAATGSSETFAAQTICTLRQNVVTAGGNTNIGVLRQNVIARSVRASSTIITLRQVVQYNRPSAIIVKFRQRVYDE